MLTCSASIACVVSQERSHLPGQDAVRAPHWPAAHRPALHERRLRVALQRQRARALSLAHDARAARQESDRAVHSTRRHGRLRQVPVRLFMRSGLADRTDTATSAWSSRTQRRRCALSWLCASAIRVAVALWLRRRGSKLLTHRSSSVAATRLVSRSLVASARRPTTSPSRSSRAMRRIYVDSHVGARRSRTRPAKSKSAAARPTLTRTGRRCTRSPRR